MALVLYKTDSSVPTIRVFAGVSFINSCKASFAVTFQNSDDSKCIAFPPVTIEYNQTFKSKTRFDYDYVILHVIEYAIKVIAGSKRRSDKVNVNFYSNSDVTAYTWETEYKKTGFIDEKGTSQVQLWETIEKSVKKNNINLTIYGENSMYNSINRSESKRAAG